LSAPSLGWETIEDSLSDMRIISICSWLSWNLESPCSS
jgi:hypothetical protein